MHRTPEHQFQHDHTIASLASHYARRQCDVWTNPANDVSKEFSGLHPDVIVHDKKGYFLFEIETEESISEEEALSEWAEFDHAWKVWYLAVPAPKRNDAINVVHSMGIEHCKVVTYQEHEDGIPTFSGIP